MEEIYWITRLGNIQALFIALTIILGILTAIFSFVLLVNISEGDSTNYQKKAIKKIIPVLIISILGIIFTPTTKEALMIWGVGGTIDYVKSNATAKQLPDKCIEALDKWVDSLNEEKTKNK
jgi:hypothetical protein